MKNLAIIFSILFSTGLYAQTESSLLVDYNLYSNIVTYTKNGEAITNPSVKEGENIYITITEFNPYIMKAELELDKNNYSQVSSDYNSSLGGGGGGGGSLSGIANLFGGLTMGAGMQDAFGGIPGSRGVADVDILESKNKFKSLTGQLEQVESKLNKSIHKLKLIEKSEQSKNLAIQDIDALKHNEMLRPSRIQELMKEEIQYAFAKNEGEKIGIEDLVDQYKKESELKETVETYNEASEEYAKLAKEWKKFSIALLLMNDDIGDMQFEFIKSAADSIQSSMEKNLNENLKNKVKTDVSEDYFTQQAKDMAYLRAVYEEINSNIFSYSFPPIQATGNEMVFEVNVSKRNKNGDLENHKSLSQSIPVTGGWKISAALGLGFGILQEQSYEYSVVNNTIVADELDDFTPMVVSFAHVYRQTNKNASVGGSFGIGFPIQSGVSVQSISFFLGPTLLLGKKQKFILSGGIMGAKVNRLGGGFAVGNDFNSSSNTLPMAQKYELGYFIGISYDLIR